MTAMTVRWYLALGVIGAVAVLVDRVISGKADAWSYVSALLLVGLVAFGYATHRGWIAQLLQRSDDSGRRRRIIVEVVQLVPMTAFGLSSAVIWTLMRSEVHPLLAIFGVLGGLVIFVGGVASMYLNARAESSDGDGPSSSMSQ